MTTTAKEIAAQLERLTCVGTQPPRRQAPGAGAQGEDAVVREVARIAAELKQAGHGWSSWLVADAFYDADAIDSEEIKAALAARLPAGCRPCLTLIPITPSPGEQPVRLQVIAAPGVSTADESARFPNAATAGAVVAVSGQSEGSGAPIDRQTDAVMEKLRHQLGSQGAGLDDVVKLNTYYVGDGTVEDWITSARVRAQYFCDPGPPAAGIPVPRLREENALISVQALAVRAAADSGLLTPLWPPGHWDWPIQVPFSHGCVCGGTAFVGGQVSLTSQAKVIDEGDLTLQTRRSLANVQAVLDSAPGGPFELLRLSAYHEAEIPKAAAIIDREVSDRFPEVALSLIALPCLGLREMVVEIEAQARRAGARDPDETTFAGEGVPRAVV